MTQEALKLALEALEEIALAGMSGTGQESERAMTEWHARQAWKFIGIAARALELIKEALREHAMREVQRLGQEIEQEPVELCQYGQEPASCTSSPMDCQCAIDAALAQPDQDHIPDARKMVTEQEPVAHCEAGPEYCPVCNTELNQEPAIYPEEAYEMGLEEIAFYTTPPQRTWVGLTDEDVNGFVEQYWDDDHMTMRSMMRAIEAKLKDLNI